MMVELNFDAKYSSNLIFLTISKRSKTDYKLSRIKITNMDHITHEEVLHQGGYAASSRKSIRDDEGLWGIYCARQMINKPREH